jgi:hypothetical protein
MKTIEPWDTDLVCITANGYFKIHTKTRQAADIHAFSIEWNKGIRVLGFMGPPAQIPEINFAENCYMKMLGEGATRFRVRLERPLDPEADTLFRSNL